ncbi:Cob(I)yrinic acid a,c-diamide adenosyltransferase, mitochondrial [Tritrichomonas foetus]|uniref:Cob(I)yrinic acid a,c-diamide adenosyltransferase, mitochondrial n=1 Tax=Tritrichomonas foetus TaxID=1144522 RepID=A0A1J4KMD3_9EUKA|nr:Cob(I)yrinic acid a,c-diamide adenosyltransferase, mitochondrial [Tritrichomonas foetus]|eukprot:OHT12387.1 Cob(I)yrinic acid a,c-diamide adenosyltransferase, mitochondrial [Tritrichomonas foetus]
MSEEERPSVSTGAGDSGFSSLAFGKPIPKDSPVFDLVGTLDELNSVLGICICYTQPDCIEYVKLVQHRLFDIGACIACNKEPSDDLKKFVSFLDKWGVELEKKIPPFQCFILPGGSVGASYYHFARTVCRRLERIEVKAIINEEHGKLYCQIINRLSDVLFILARYHNTAVNVPEIPYESKPNPPI